MLVIEPYLFDLMAMHMVKTLGYSPSTAKVRSYLNFDYKGEGQSFDDIVNCLKISKSTASTAIQLLLDEQQIYFKYKENDRKRYFFINENFVKFQYEKIIEKLKEEEEIIQLVYQHQKELKIKNKHLEKKLDIFNKAVKNSIQNLENAIQNLNEI